jgi:group I intron endonuclease
MRKSYIYKITNIINNKIYVGQSINPKRRWYHHRWCARNPEKSTENNTILYNAMRKHGEENFKFEIIEETELININDREIYWIKELNTLSTNGYNMTAGGQGSNEMSIEAREKISKALKGRKCSKEHIEKVKQAKIGLTLSDEHKQKIQATLQGRIFSEDHLEKIRIATSDTIIQYDTEDNELNRFIGYNEAVDWIRKNTKFKGDKSTIRDSINGKYATAYGYKWTKIEVRKRVSTIENFKKEVEYSRG